MKRKFLCLILSAVMALGLSVTCLAGPIELPMIPGDTTDDAPAGLVYTISSGKATVTGYTGSASALTIPEKIKQCPVTAITGIGSQPTLKELSIPAGVISIDISAFQQVCLDKITVAYGNPIYSTSSDGVLFNKAKTQLLLMPSGKTGNYTVPGTVTAIGSGAFWSSSLTQVVIPDSVTRIGSAAFRASALTGVTIPDSVTELGVYAFFGCSSLAQVQLSQQLSKLDDSVFYNCAALTAIDIPDSVESIALTAFWGCSQLTNVTLGSGITRLELDAFGYCQELTFTGDAPQILPVTEFDFVANAYYPAENSTWTDDMLQDYGGRITWIPYCTTQPGDLDGIPGVDNRDVEFLLWYTLFPEEYPLSADADFDGNDVIDNQDVEYLLWHTLFPDEYPL